jgi:hypothetical protein
VHQPDVAPLRVRTAFTGLILIYGLSAISCALINWWVARYPIGPWSVSDLPANSWLDNVSWQIFSLWWACLFAVCQCWPFDSLPRFWRGSATLVTAWTLGWLTAKAIFATGLGVSWIFPLVGTTWFFIAFFSFNGENWLVRGFSPARRFFLLLVLITGCTYLITHSAIRWIPAWWFPFNLLGAATGTLAYITRGMTQPAKAFMQMALLFCSAALCLWVSSALGLWSSSPSPISGFWQMGTATADNHWLVFFMVSASINFGVPVVLHNWPFTRFPMPWGGLLACVFYIVLDIVLSFLLIRLVGPVFSSTEELLTYAYMGVNWSMTLPLLFGLGMSEAYLWTGQRTVGEWNDLPA